MFKNIKMKKIIKILIVFLTSISIFSIWNVSFAENIEWLWDITSGKTTNTLNKSGSEVSKNIKDVSWEIIDIVRYVFAGILVIFIVYAWVQMILSMGTNEDDLSKSKRTIWYALIWLVFIIFPIEIYKIFIWESKAWSDFFNMKVIEDIILAIVNFLEIIVIWIAIFMIVLTGIKIITSRWRDEKITEAKNKIIWVIVALIFIWFIEVWKNFLIWWKSGNFKISDWIDIFQSLANLALYLVWPIALFFLTLAWYYYITAAWDEEKAKKWKNIIINMLIWIIIVLCAYVLLNDLSLLTI